MSVGFLSFFLFFFHVKAPGFGNKDDAMNFFRELDDNQIHTQ